MAWIQQHKLMVVGLVLAVCGLAYVLFQDRITNISLPKIGALQQSSENDMAYQEALAVLADVKRISLDTTIFENPKFLSFFDFSRPIDPKPLGRRNPFLPIGR
jgi:hypothetical protein